MNPSVPRLEVHSRWIGTCARNALVITAPALLISFPDTEVVEPGMAIVVMILMQVLLVQVVQVLLVYMHRCLHRLHRCLDPGPVAMHLPEHRGTLTRTCCINLSAALCAGFPAHLRNALPVALWLLPSSNDFKLLNQWQKMTPLWFIPLLLVSLEGMYVLQLQGDTTALQP